MYMLSKRILKRPLSVSDTKASPFLAGVTLVSSCLFLLAHRTSRSGLLIAWFSGNLELGSGFPQDPDDIAGDGLSPLAVSGWPAALMTPPRAPRVSARGKTPDGKPFILVSSSGRVEPWLE